MSTRVDDRPRAEHDFDFELGCVVKSDDNRDYVFVGWATTTVGRSPVFVEAFNDNRWGYQSVRTYFCTFSETLLRKLPGTAFYKRIE